MFAPPQICGDRRKERETQIKNASPKPTSGKTRQTQGKRGPQKGPKTLFP